LGGVTVVAYFTVVACILTFAGILAVAGIVGISAVPFEIERWISKRFENECVK
jgi:hypothetical protein